MLECPGRQTADC